MAAAGGAVAAPRSVSAAVALVERDARRRDELVRLWRARSEAAAAGVTDPHPLAQQRRHSADEVLPRNEVRVALRDRRIAGLIAATRESIAQLSERVGCRRQGIRRARLAQAKDRPSGHLRLDPYARNRGAQAFCAGCGFVVAARGFEPMRQLEDIRYEWHGA